MCGGGGGGGVEGFDVRKECPRKNKWYYNYFYIYI